jgi:dTDP-4-dehydrorhamnose reductase
MLGHKLLQQLSSGLETFATVRDDGRALERLGLAKQHQLISNIDVCSDADLRRAIEIARPEVVINAVGVIKQLPNSSDVINTLTVNSILPHRLKLMSQEYKFRLIVISTDCVFSGARGNYSEVDPADALDLYGRSKNLGEIVADGCLTIRTSIIGRELVSSHSLIEWFLSNRGGTVKGYTKAIYSGFPTVVFADIMSDLLINYPNLQGIYHISSDPIDKFRLLELVNDAFSANIRIEPDDSLKIDRSLDSAKFRAATGFAPPDWKGMVHRMATDAKPYDEWRK